MSIYSYVRISVRKCYSLYCYCNSFIQILCTPDSHISTLIRWNLYKRHIYQNWCDIDNNVESHFGSYIWICTGQCEKCLEIVRCPSFRALLVVSWLSISASNKVRIVIPPFCYLLYMFCLISARSCTSLQQWIREQVHSYHHLYRVVYWLMWSDEWWTCKFNPHLLIKPPVTVICSIVKKRIYVCIGMHCFRIKKIFHRQKGSWVGGVQCTSP